MPIIDMTRYGACPFCGCRQLRHDRIPPDRVAIIVYVRDYLNKGLYFRYWDGIKLLDISDISVRPLTSNERTLFSVLKQYGEKYPQAVSYWDYQDACGGAFTTGWPTALVFNFILPTHLLTGSAK